VIDLTAGKTPVTADVEAEFWEMGWRMGRRG